MQQNEENLLKMTIIEVSKKYIKIYELTRS